jgi:DNA-binding NtrC family response regulator
MAEKLLIVEDEDTLRFSLKRVFLREGYEVDVAPDAETAVEFIKEKIYDLIITDIILPNMDGIELLKHIREEMPDQIVIIITAFASLETAVEALRAGAYDYVVKPIIHEEIKQIVRNALKQKMLQKEVTYLKRQIERRYDFSKIIGESDSMKRIINEVKKIANARSNVLLLGETGTGKELIARAIHFNSNRADKPFIPINCSAIPENLLESELFGHMKGAFTGAITSKRGLFEEANGGTIFLDEIGDLSINLQSKLLRVLEDQEIRPVGGTQSIKVDIRFISATNKDIVSAVKDGSFREDLFYRINVITIKLPPLRERREDIELLVRYFIQKFSFELGKRVNGIDEEALSHIKKYNWPGNIRELQNVIERAILISESSLISSEHLPEEMVSSNNSFHDYALSNKLSIEEYTKEFIQRYQNDFTEQQLADMLGITRKSLWEKRKKWSIPRE